MTTTISVDQLAMDSYNHAIDVIKGRFPEGESLILLSQRCIHLYAENIIKGRWPEAEAFILTNASDSYYYARYIIKGRWPEAETIINSDKTYAYKYNNFLAKLEPKKPTIEEYMAKIKVLEDKLSEIAKLLK
jgi:hypothetical protein